MAEQEQFEREDQMQEAGMPPRDLSPYTSWRENTDSCVLSALAFYGTYLSGQTNGLTDGLSLQSVLAAFEIDGTEPDDRPELTRRVKIIHGEAMSIIRFREKSVSHHA
jgi:hypothetical protein